MCRTYDVPQRNPKGGYVRVCANVSSGRYRGWKLWYVGVCPVHGGHLTAAQVKNWPHGKIEVQ